MPKLSVFNSVSIDAYQFVVVPVVLGAGRTMFDGVTARPRLKPTRSRSFGNGYVVLWCEA